MPTSSLSAHGLLIAELKLRWNPRSMISNRSPCRITMRGADLRTNEFGSLAATAGTLLRTPWLNPFFALIWQMLHTLSDRRKIRGFEEDGLYAIRHGE